MRFRSLEKWDNKEKLNSLIFYAQRAEELLFDFTIDSYKPMSLNAPFLCSEAINVIADIQKELIDKSNLKPILEELTWSIKNDPVSKHLIDLPYETYILNPEHDQLENIELKLSVLKRTLSPYRYLDCCIDFLYQSITNNKKKDIDTFARLMFTCMINMGVNKSYLYRQVIDFFYTGETPKKIEKTSDFENFVKVIYPTSHKFEMFFWVSGLIDTVAESTKPFGVEIIDALPTEVSDSLKEQKSTLPDLTYGKLAKVSNFRALDWFSAKEIAEAKLSRLRDLYNLYHHKSKIKWDDNVVVTQCCENKPRILGLLKSPIEKTADERPEQASRKLNKLLKRLRLSKESFEKFNRAVDFHSLSANSKDVENQLLNLWIGLETITPTHSNSAKISQICEGLKPFLTIGYTRKLLHNTAIDLIRWDRRTVQTLLKKIDFPKNIKLIEKLAILIISPTLEDYRQELYKALKDFHLLRYRVFNLNQRLSTPKKVLDLIKEHEKKVLWQVRRIYRSRNLLVHTGRSLQYLPSLVENAHDYFDQTLFIFIRMCVGDYRINSISESFELAKITRTMLDKKLENIEEFDNDSSLILINNYNFMIMEDRWVNKK